MTTKPMSLKAMRSAGKIGSRDLYQIDVRDFVVVPGQSGRDETTEAFAESIKSLTAFLEAGGAVPPVEFRINDAGEIELVQGHRRRLAFLDVLTKRVAEADKHGLLTPEKLAKLWRIDAVPFEGNDLQRVLRRVTGNEHLALSAMELANNYAELRDKFQLNVAELCRQLHKDRYHVETHLALFDAGHQVQAAVKAGDIKPTEAAKLVKQHGDAAGEVIGKLKDAAKAQGKKRITAGVTGGRSLPKPLVNDLRDRVSNLVTKLPKPTAKLLNDYRKDPDQYDPDEHVSVPLAMLAGLTAAHQNVVDKLAELDAKDKARADGQAPKSDEDDDL